MIVRFNENGVITSVTTDMDSLRQGSTSVVLDAYFPYDNTEYVATVNFTRSDGSSISNVVMTLDANDENHYSLPFSDEWYFAKDGQTTLTIFLRNSGGQITAQGQYIFNIESTDYHEEPDTITNEQYNSLLAQIAGLTSLYVTINGSQTIIGVKNFSAGAVFSSFMLGDTVFTPIDGVGFSVDGAIIPDEDNKILLGSEDQQWNGIYAGFISDRDGNALYWENGVLYCDSLGVNQYKVSLNEKDEVINGSKTFSKETTFNNNVIMGPENNIILDNGTIHSNSRKVFSIGSNIRLSTWFQFPAEDVSHGVLDPFTLATEEYVRGYSYPKANTYTKSQIDTLFSSALVYRGSLTVAQVNSYDTSTLKVGSFFNVSDGGIITLGDFEVFAGDNIVWTGSSWDKVTMDLSAYDDKFISAGFFEVSEYNAETGEITFTYASDLYDMSYDSGTGILTITAI